jgi:hypothetical protein
LVEDLAVLAAEVAAPGVAAVAVILAAEAHLAHGKFKTLVHSRIFATLEMAVSFSSSPAE